MMNDTSVSQLQMSSVVAAESKDKKVEDAGKQVSHIFTSCSLNLLSDTQCRLVNNHFCGIDGHIV